MSHPIPGQEYDEHYRGEHESESQQAKRLGKERAGGALGKSFRRKFEKVKAGAKRDGRKEALDNIRQEKFGRAISKLAKKRPAGGPTQQLGKLGTKAWPFPDK